MESRAKLFGHPIHPKLIVLPLGLFIAAVAFDGLYFWSQSLSFATTASWNILGGVIGGLLAAVFGLIDWLAIPRGTRAKRVGLLHGLTMVVVVLTFATIWFLRRGSVFQEPTAGMFAIELGALMLAAVGGWLGGELVDRLAVGVDEGANLNAPSSLSGPARPTR